MAWISEKVVGVNICFFLPRRVVFRTRGEEFHSENATANPWDRSHCDKSDNCVDFPDLGTLGPRGRLPSSDDVLAKWMALTGDEKRLINEANMHLPGRQVDPARVRRDLWRLQMWERERRDSPTGAKKR